GWTIHGVVRSRITLDKFGVSFGEAPVRGEVPPTQTVRATVHIPFKKLQAKFDPMAISVQVLQQKDRQNEFDVVIAPNSNLPAGPFDFSLPIDLVGEDGEKIPGISRDVSGTMQNEVRLIPAKIFLGSKPIGSTAEGEIVLQPPDKVQLVVEQIETDSSDVEIEPVSIEGFPPARTYRIKQKIAKAGDQVSQVGFVIRKEGHPPMKVTMEVCYRGEVIEPDRQISAQRKVP